MSSLLQIMGYGKVNAAPAVNDSKTTPRGAASPTTTAQTDVNNDDEADDADDADETKTKVINVKPRVKRKSPHVPIPVPDDAGSSTQASKAKSKAGFCYIGEDRGFRSCIKVGESEKCMSGDIFPTQDLCINPRLRQ